MPTQPFVAGPCFLYTGTGSLAAKNAEPFCVCEDTPQVRIDSEWEPLYNSLGGSKIPSDQAFQGENAIVRVDTTKWSEDVYLKLAAKPWFSGIRGTHFFGDYGTLMLSEGAYYPLWLRFPYRGTKPAMATMPAGYKFVASWLGAGDDLGPLNTKPRRLSLVFVCQRILNPLTLAWTLYNHDMTGLPNFL